MTAGEKLRWVVAGGGTGGHVTPALALAERIAARGDEVVLLGTERGLERRLVPEAGFELLTLPARQLTGKGLAAPARRRPRACSRRAPRPGACSAAAASTLVLSVGGYASVPAVVAAAMRRLPIALVEPNAIPGRANRDGGAPRHPALRAVRGGRRGARGQRRRRARAQRRDPAARALVAAFAAAPPRRTPAAPWRLLVFGGSQGARQLNDAMLEAIPLARRDPARDLPPDRGRPTASGWRRPTPRPACGPRWRPSSPRCPAATAGPTSALCRAGALTVAELCLAALPSVLVPYPHAADDHQRANARALARAGAARVLEPATLSGKQVAGVLRELFAEPGELSNMSAAAGKLAQPDAAERIVAECAEIARARRRGNPA